MLKNLFPADIFNTYVGEGQGLRFDCVLKNTRFNLFYALDLFFFRSHTDWYILKFCAYIFRFNNVDSNFLLN